jgi:hypothetical protein
MTNEEWFKLERVIKSARTPGQYKVARKFAEQLTEEKRPLISDEEYNFIKRTLGIILVLGAATAFGIIILVLSLFF